MAILFDYQHQVSQPSHLRIAPIVEELSPANAAAWDAYVLSKPGVTLYHLYAWRTVAERAYGIKAPFLVARERNNPAIRGVLPLFHIPRPFTPYLTNGLFGAYGGLLADDYYYERALARAAMTRVERGDADYLHLKLLGEQTWPHFQRKDIWVTARLSLGSNEQETWRGLSSGMRTKIRRAQNAGFVTNTSSDLDGFYDVLSENMLRKGSPMYGRSFFDTLLSELGSRASVLTVQQNSRVVSAAFLAWVNGTLYVPFASSRPEVFRLKVNQLLWWEIIRFAHEQGLKTLDFGSSLRDSSGLQFKKYWGPRIEPIASQIYAGRGVTPVLAPADSRLARSTVAAWSHLPRAWAETLGPRIIRWIA